MPTPAEQAAEGSATGGHDLAGDVANPSPDDTNPLPRTTVPEPEPGSPQDPATAAPTTELPTTGLPTTGLPTTGLPTTGTSGEPPQPNRAATASLVAGILGVTGLGILLGLGFGVAGVARSRTAHTGRTRAWIGIVLSLLWAGGFAYVAPHVIKAADPGCTYFKEKVLPHYNTAIVDLNTRAGSNKTTSDLATAVAGLATAAGKSRNRQASNALRALTTQLKTASNDQIGGQIPSSVMSTLNHDAVMADNACGTI
jgi:hypothetical protein